jgi:hypothetical protein
VDRSVERPLHSFQTFDPKLPSGVDARGLRLV